MHKVRLLLTLAILSATGGIGIMNPAASAANQTIPAESTYFAYLPHLSGEQCGPFTDTFDDPTSGWFTGRRDSLVAEYLQGEYRFMVTQPMTVWLVVAPGCPRTEYRAEIDARWAGRPGNFYALIFDIPNGLNGAYLFAVNTDKRVWLVMQVRGGELAFIVPETGNSAILPGGQVNRLAAERRGETIFLFINGTPVGELRTGQSGRPSAAGLAVATYTDAAPADARFDNYRHAGTYALTSAAGTDAKSDGTTAFGPLRLTVTSSSGD